MTHVCARYVSILVLDIPKMYMAFITGAGHKAAVSVGERKGIYASRMPFYLTGIVESAFKVRVGDAFSSL